MAAQNNAIRINYIKPRIDKTQKNSRYRLCGDRDETIKQIIGEYSKLAYKEDRTHLNLVGKLIYRELGKKFKFDQTNGICTTRYLLWRMRRTNSSGIL